MLPQPRGTPRRVPPPRARAAVVDPDAGEDDPPPAYGVTFGRVLGTGEPPSGDAHIPSGVRMVSDQDLEASDGEAADHAAADDDDHTDDEMLP